MGMIGEIISKGLIEPQELNSLMHNGETNLKVLDGSFAHDHAAIKPFQSFQNAHIAGAQFFDIKDVADKTSPLSHMVPTPESFNAHISKLGIEKGDLIVVYGQSGIVMGPARVWWMMRLFGHNNVCVLNGGLKAWSAAGYELSSGPAPSPAPSNYESDFKPELLLRLDDMLNAVKADKQILDARSKERFSGAVSEPRDGMRRGHIPGSQSLPCIELIDHNTGKMKSAADLRMIFETMGIDMKAPILSTCGSGITACVIALALHQIGHSDVAVYDGSWSEWGHESSGMEVAQSA